MINFIIKFINCSNKSCRTADYSKNDRYKSFLPIEIAEEVIENISNIYKKTSRLSVESWLENGYTKEEAEKEISKIQSETSLNNLNRFIPSRDNLLNFGYTEEEVNSICLTPSQVGFWLKKGFTEDESIKKISTHQTKIANEFADKRRNNPGEYSAVTQTQIGYWINKGFSDEESKEKVAEIQKTFSLDICIEKYGEEEGKKIFTKRQNKWNKSLNEGGNLKIGYSKISQDLFEVLLDKYIDKDSVYFATHNKEYRLEKEQGGVWLYDFSDIKRKKIIEYHGDMFHGNPKKYLAEDYPHPFRKTMTAQEMWDKDEKKKKAAEEEGFEIFVVWDSEYRWGNKQKVINKCLEFLEL